MTEKNDFRLRPMSMDDIDMVYQWRTRPEISEYMFSDEDITLEKHQRWFKRVLEDDAVDYRILEYKGKPVGQANVIDIDPYKKSCYWGFYIGDKNAPKGSGTVMGELMIHNIFDTYPVDIIYGEAFAFNIASLKLHEKLGFQTREDLAYAIEKQHRQEQVVVMELHRNSQN